MPGRLSRRDFLSHCDHVAERNPHLDFGSVCWSALREERPDLFLRMPIYADPRHNHPNLFYGWLRKVWDEPL